LRKDVIRAKQKQNIYLMNKRRRERCRCFVYDELLCRKSKKYKMIWFIN